MDCMELFPAVPDGCVSMILTDPPYGIRYQNHFTSRRHPKLAGDEGIDYERFAAESYRILKDNAHAYFFTRFDCYPHHYGCLERAGFTVKNCLVVEKGTVGGIGDLQGIIGKLDYLRELGVDAVITNYVERRMSLGMARI